MEPKPVWLKRSLPRYPQLNRGGRFDVIVIGGGITGLTAAYLLKKSGKSVCLLERNRLGGGETGHTTAHLTLVSDLRLHALAKNFGNKIARLVWQGGAAAINTIERIAEFEQIDCDFRRVPGFLHLSPDAEDASTERKLLRRDARLANELGFHAAFTEHVPYFNTAGVNFSNQARFHPLAYLRGLAEFIDGDESAIHEHTEVKEVQADGIVVTTRDKRVQGDYTIIATHVPLMGKSNLASATLFQTKLYPYSSYAIGARVASGAVPEALYWDTSDPYYYLRVDRHSNHDYLIFGGLDHKTGQSSDTAKRYARLEARLAETAPKAKVVDRWSGQVIETNDGLPYIGETAERQFTATGFAGNGMTFGTLAAMMATDAVLERQNPWQPIFDVRRKKLRGGLWDYLKENFDYPYYLLKDRLTPAEGTSTRQLKPDEGKVLNLDGQRVACYRDPEGKLHKVSAACTHMGCLVHWNGAERTWDCPCHGSRFLPDGQVIGGPAEAPLEPVEKKAADKKASESQAAKRKQQTIGSSS